MLHSDHPDLQIEALVRIEHLKFLPALAAVHNLSISSPHAAVQGAAIRTRCALEDADAVEEVIPYLDNHRVEIRLGAAVGLLRYGSVSGILGVGERLRSWEQSSDEDERCFLADVIGESALTQFYQPLVPLLSDPVLKVRIAALRAAGQVRHIRLLPMVVDNLSDRTTRSAAMDALVAFGTVIVPTVAEALSGNALSQETTVRLVRACHLIKGDEIVDLMRRHINHSSPMVREQVLAVLSACAFHAQDRELALLNDTLVAEASQGHQLLRALEDIGESGATAPLQRALLDELAQVSKRLFWLLSFMYESESLLQAGSQLLEGSRSDRALAIEMLDVTLASSHKALVFPLIDTKLERSQRIRLLDQVAEAKAMSSVERLRDLLTERYQEWVRACSLYAVAERMEVSMIPQVESALTDPAPVVRETAAWSLFKLAPDRFREHAQPLTEDEDSHVVRMAVDLLRRSEG